MSISSSNTPNALRVEIQPSNYFRAALTGVALIALGAIFYADLHWLPRAALVLLIVVYAAHGWRAQFKQRGLLQWRSVWFWRGAEGSERALQLRRSTVWPGMIVMIFSDIERNDKFALVLFADNFLNSDSARRLRVYLHHFPVFTDAAADENSPADANTE